MEWTKADVLRIMKEKASPDGKVSIPDVRVSFLGSGPTKNAKKDDYFNECLKTLAAEGKVSTNSAVGSFEGRVL